MVEWIICNKEWIFSGLGIAIISAFFAILKTKNPKGGEGNPIFDSYITQQ